MGHTVDIIQAGLGNIEWQSTIIIKNRRRTRALKLNYPLPSYPEPNYFGDTFKITLLGNLKVQGA